MSDMRKMGTLHTRHELGRAFLDKLEPVMFSARKRWVIA
jgi:hypothetical protein